MTARFALRPEKGERNDKPARRRIYWVSTGFRGRALSDKTIGDNKVARGQMRQLSMKVSEFPANVTRIDFLFQR